MKKKLTPLHLSLAGMFTALMAIGANITSFVPFMVIGGVPITLQTFIAILSGAILGSRLSAIAMTVYALVGIAGVPVFAKFGSGFATVISPTFGFILTYILAAYATGKIIEKNASKASYITAALVGLAINYILGTNYMYFAYKLWFAAPEGFTYAMAWIWMLVPLPKDIILSVLAGLLALRLNRNALSVSRLNKLKQSA
ncbi:biotin transporter BioY [Bacillus infantis]|uniref:biotin transporter BioY n=1 Tax=Bacillus infantis TaxID=324767 RepID=UPI003CF3CE7C